MTDLHFLTGGGEMGARTRAFDWSRTPLGPPSTWPQSLRSAVSIMLPSKAQIVLFWGPDLVTLYNDAYRPVYGAKHPGALGLPAREVWREIWDSVLSDLFGGVIRTGEAFWAKDRQFILERNGYPEENFFDVSYDPIRDESGNVGGIFCIVGETTGRVVGERRLQTLRDLATRNADARTELDSCNWSLKALEANPHDVPFAAIYLSRGDDQPPELASETPGLGALADPARWPFAETNSVQRVALDSASGDLPRGAWDRAPTEAVIVPIQTSGTGRAGWLLMGLNPYRPLDDDYRTFVELVSAQIGAGIAYARAYQQERERAEALASLDRAKTAFFSNVSHEFRTPLTLMLGPVEDALADSEHPLDPVHRERHELIRRNGRRLQKLVTTLLDFSRIEAGRAHASYMPVDLPALTGDLASGFRSAVEKAGLELTVDLSPLGEPVYVDRDMWEKIVLNLLSNAFKFTFRGGITVSLKRKGGIAELAVRDTGTGIPSADLPHVFERFRRVEGARSRTHEGTGIGLALVQELVKLHGGTVTAESMEGVGTTFTVSVPLGRSHLPAEHVENNPVEGGRSPVTSLGSQPFIDEALHWIAEDAAETAPAGAASQGPRPRIVWADDNADMREYVRRLLGACYDVEAVPDGEAALAAIRSRRPDLVLSDSMMPRLDVGSSRVDLQACKLEYSIVSPK